MPLTKSIFNYKYYKYSLKRALPYVLTMGIIMYAINFVVYALGFSMFQYSGIANVLEISYPNFFFIYFYPVLLSIGLFNFLYKKSTSDFFGSIPVKRTTMFLTNIAIGATVFFIMLLLNTLMLALIFKVLFSSSVVIATPVFFYYFFFWFIGFMVMFSGASLAATVSGSITAQIFLTAVIMFIPGILVNIAQIPLYGALSYSLTDTIGVTQNAVNIGSVSIENIIRPLSIPYSFISDLFLSSTLYNLDAFYGSFRGFTNIGIMLYNVVIIFVFVAVGAYLMKIRKFEIAENPYANKYIMGISKALAFLPFLILIFYAAIQDLDVEAVALLITLLTTGYIIVDLILKKNFRNFGKSMLLYATCFVLSIVFSLGINTTETSLKSKKIEVNENNIKELVFYMQPYNISSSKAIKDFYIPLKIKDENIIGLFTKSIYERVNPNVSYPIAEDSYDDSKFEYNNKFNSTFATIKLENGKKITNKYGISNNLKEALFSYIDNDAKIKESLDIYNKIKLNKMANVLLINRYEFGEFKRTNKTILNNNPEVFEFVTQINNQRKPLSTKERYNKALNLNIYDSYAYRLDRFYELFPTEQSKSNLYLKMIYYHNGHYIEDIISIDMQNDLTKKFIADINKKAEKSLKKLKENDFRAEILSKTDKADKVFLGQMHIWDGISLTMGDELKNIALSADKEKPFDGTPIQLNFYNKPEIVSMSSAYYENRLEKKLATVFVNLNELNPLIDEYKQKALNALDTLNENDIVELNVQTWTDGEVLSYVSEFSKYSNKSSLYAVFEQCKNNKESIKKYYENEYSLDELTGDISIVRVIDKKGHLYVYIFDTKDDFIKLVEREYGKYDYEPEENISYLLFDDVKIDDPDDILYFLKATKNEFGYGGYFEKNVDIRVFIYYKDGSISEVYNINMSSKMKNKLEKLRAEQGGE